MAEEFSFDVTKTENLAALNKGQNKLVSLIEAIYKEDQVDRSPVEYAHMTIFAYGAFKDSMVAGSEFWLAISQAVCALLEEYPLRGYSPAQVGFNNG